MAVEPSGTGQDERSHGLRLLRIGVVAFWLLAACGWGAFAYRALTDRADLRDLRAEVRGLRLEHRRLAEAETAARRALDEAQGSLAVARQELAALREQLAARDRAPSPPLPASPPPAAGGRRPTR